MSSPASLPKEIHLSAKRGELQKVVKWLRKGGLVDALCPTTTPGGLAIASSLLHAASGYDHPSIVLVLLQHSADPDLQNIYGHTALMQAALNGYEACVCRPCCEPRPTPS